MPLEGERPPLNAVYVDTLFLDGYRIEKLYYESLPNLYVPANLYVPDSITSPVPAILYTCGHAETQKVAYQAHPRKFAQLGFVCLIIETIQWGEVLGHHRGPYNQGWFNWYSRGYFPGGVEAWNGIRGIDLLCSRPEVDSTCLGVTGNSGGGAQSWFIAAIDSRIKASASSCGAGLVQSHVQTRTINYHCDCMMPINTYLIDFPAIGALIAPRPFMIVSTQEDPLYEIESARQCHQYVETIYDLYGAEDSLYFVEAPGRHGYNEETRPQIFQFFLKHLMGKELSLEETGDVDESDSVQLSEDDLRVYVNGAPADDITTSIQDSFVKRAEPPQIVDIQSLENHRQDIKDFLKIRTFSAFPSDTVAFDTLQVFNSMDGTLPDTTILTFCTEAEWRLKLDIRWRNSPDEEKPMMLVLRNPLEDTMAAEASMEGLNRHWNIAYFDVRGVGDTEWSQNLNWYIRRSLAWAGRTVASTRVYDVLRCLSLLRTFEGTNPNKIGIAAEGEMCAIGLYAAFLDENIPVVMLKEPPATQDVVSNRDGKGESIEMLNCLRITDLPQLAGLLFPAEIVMVGKISEYYKWAESLYHSLGKPEYFQKIQRVEDWNPITAVKNTQYATPEQFSLIQNYPNPFNSNTTIKYILPKESKVIIKIYNILGKEIKSLIEQNQVAGNYSIQWNGIDNSGFPVSSGIYICKIKTENEIKSIKMIQLK